MSERHNAPQKSFIFRVIAALTSIRYDYLFRNLKSTRILAMVFVMICGSTSLATIAAAAYIINLPLLFPPLSPSAYIIFNTPLALTACPRSVILSHTLGVGAGLFSLFLIQSSCSVALTCDFSALSWHMILSITIAMALTTAFMVLFNCSHPPAMASALIASMGYLDDITKIIGILTAVVILAIEGILFNRIFGGLPYPLWKGNPEMIRHYGVLAGLPKQGERYWEELSTRILRQRKP